MRYRTKPFEIEAVKFDTRDDAEAVREAFPDIQLEFDDGFDGENMVRDVLQNTWVGVNLGDYIIRGMKGEYYPCDAEVFEAKYETAD